jgi:hypothetical protein
MRAVISSAIASILAASLAAGCASAPKVTKPPPPLRPTPIVVDDPGGAEPARPTDCTPTDPQSSPASVPYTKRSVEEATNLANEGFKKLTEAERRDQTPQQRETLVTEAVEAFITALRADAYNVHATYNLAAAYGRIGRVQCSINLLARLVDLRKLASQTDAVELKIDRLLGRAKFAGALDPDFREMRDLQVFRDLVKQLDPNQTDTP